MVYSQWTLISKEVIPMSDIKPKKMLGMGAFWISFKKMGPDVAVIESRDCPLHVGEERNMNASPYQSHLNWLKH